ncbi:hypothetical protein NE237_010112 [Protea cynaroides]|uniref:Uncharacterized protein n=1 Tax=Protea cynaroides TaxID=273540 RepID=A0A9Q0R1A3_9MAGN|nr:hypothetical protein NE237_010112 [Protea cynaroides]
MCKVSFIPAMVDVVEGSISALGWKPMVVGGSLRESALVVRELLTEELLMMVFSAGRLCSARGVSSREGAESRLETGGLLSEMVFPTVISSIVAGGMQKDRGSDDGLRSKFSVALVVVMLHLTHGGVLAEGVVSQSVTTVDVADQLLQRQDLLGTRVN